MQSNSGETYGEKIVMKKKVIIAIGVLFIIAAGLIFYFTYNRQIGSISGPEGDIVTIGEVEYVRTDSVSKGEVRYSFADRRKHLGIIKSGDRTLHVYDIKGDVDRDYIYIRWEWESIPYVRKEIVQE